jgi:hypothetical protein
MKYDKLVSQILEDFNVFPQTVNAVRSGPDQGMTSVQLQQTFPSSMSKVDIKLPGKKKKKKKLKAKD